MTTPEHLGGNRYRVRIELDPVRGKRVQRSRNFSANGMKAAKRKATQIEGALRRDLTTGVLGQGTVGKLVDDWLRAKTRQERSPTTMYGYEFWAKRITARFGTVRAETLKGAAIDDWYDDMLAAGKTKATVANAAKHLRMVLMYGNHKQDLPRVATRQATPSIHVAAEIAPPSNDEIARAVAILRAGGQSSTTGRGATKAKARMRAEWSRCIELLMATGLRRGEVVGLRWDDWDELAGVVTVRHSVVEPAGKPLSVKETKGKRNRDIELGVTGNDILAEQRDCVAANGSSPWVFPNWRSDAAGSVPRSPGSLNVTWSRFRKEHGLEGIRLHDLRHWYATMAVDSGVPLAVLQGQLGHAQLSTTMNIYVHPTDEGRKLIGSAVDRAFGLSAPETPAVSAHDTDLNALDGPV
mgnify:CR=1 FL=1